MRPTVTLHPRYGYVGPIKRSSTTIKVDGRIWARVVSGKAGYFAQFSFNAGRTYTWSWSAEPDKKECIRKAVAAAKDLERGLRPK